MRELPAALALLASAAPARADFFDDLRRTFQKDSPRTFEEDIPRAFGANPRKGPAPVAPVKPPPENSQRR